MRQAEGEVKVKTAVISDIHGNIWAFEAILADIRQRGVERILNLGDAFYGPLRPGAVAERLVGSDIISIRGNGDRRMAAADGREQNKTVLAACAQLTAEQMGWLRALPPDYVYERDVLLCHGIPGDDHTYLLEEIRGETTIPKDSALLAGYLAGTEQPLILCGHSHLPRVVWLSDGRLIVNPGSVGLPAFDEDTPHYFKVESGSPHAKYAIVTRTDGFWQAEQIYIRYDWEAAARQAEANGRSDWAKWLRTGRA